MFAFTRQFTETPDFQTGRFILCKVFTEARDRKIVRSSSKWAVSHAEIPPSVPDLYPNYCVGAIYILTPATAAAIVEAAKHVKFLWIDDVWVTGYLPAFLNITHQVLSWYFWGVFWGFYE